MDDAARLLRELRLDGKGESTLQNVSKVANRVFKFAKRRLQWHGENPLEGLDSSERPKVSVSKRRIFQGSELAETLAAAEDVPHVVELRDGGPGVMVRR